VNLACFYAVVAIQDYIDAKTREFARNQLQAMSKTLQGLSDLESACVQLAGSGNERAVEYLTAIIKRG